MDTIESARQIIHDAEIALKELISKALAEQRYADVREIAGFADRLAQLLPGDKIKLSASACSVPPELSEPRRVADLAQSVMFVETKRTARRKRSSSEKKGYPKFVRDGDRLVKIGWSKKNKEEYEHRVPREAVLAFVRHLNNKVEQAQLFDIDSLLPVNDSSGEEVPGYQIYVIVAWLRAADIIQRVGRDGYTFRDRSVLSGELDERWQSLATRSG